MATKNDKNSGDEKKWKGHTCGECANCTPYMAQHTLTVLDKKPTMGTCPHWTESKCLLLSQAALECFC